MTDRLLTANEAADLLAVPVSWIREQTRAGALPHITLGRYRRYDKAELLAWVESLRTGGGATFRKHQPHAPSSH